MNPSTTITRAPGHLTPNHVARRSEIATSTVALLLREGVGGCTVRSIAAAAGVSKGALHYYFSDVDEIIDAAMLQAVRAWVAWVRSSEVEGPATAEQVFWRSMSSCLAPFAQGDRTLMPLWLEYWTVCVRKQRTAALRRMQRLMVSHVAELLGAVGIDRADERAVGVASYLFGAGMQQPVEPLALPVIFGHIAALCGLDPPDDRPGPASEREAP